jgi:hypothetical protein
VKGTGKGKGTKNEKGKGKEKATENGKWKGNSKGKGVVNKPQEEMISLVPLLCICRKNCMRQTRTRRANLSGYI